MPIGEQHLLEVVALVEVREQRPLEEEPEEHRQRDAQHHRDGEAAGQRRQRERHVRADHVEAAVREVDDPHDAEDQRQPARDQEQQQSVLERVQELDQREFHGVGVGGSGERRPSRRGSARRQ